MRLLQHPTHTMGQKFSVVLIKSGVPAFGLIPALKSSKLLLNLETITSISVNSGSKGALQIVRKKMSVVAC